MFRKMVLILVRLAFSGSERLLGACQSPDLLKRLRLIGSISVRGKKCRRRAMVGLGATSTLSALRTVRALLTGAMAWITSAGFADNTMG